MAYTMLISWLFISVFLCVYLQSLIVRLFLVIFTLTLLLFYDYSVAFLGQDTLARYLSLLYKG